MSASDLNLNGTSNISSSDIYSNEYGSNDNEYNENETENNNIKTHKRKTLPKKDSNNKLSIKRYKLHGTHNLHILPVKLNGTNFDDCPVENYFEPTININENECEGAFRGRPLKGKTFKNEPKNSNYTLEIYTIDNRQSKNNELKIVGIDNIENYTIWKYDENIEENNTFNNLNQVIKDLSVLG